MDRFQIVAPVVRARLAEPYAYGTADCFAMGMAVAKALTGTDHGKPYRSRYKTEQGAARLMRKLGHDSLASLLREHFAEIAPAQARIGDLSVVLSGEGEHVAVCMGSDFIVKTLRGRRAFNVTNCIAAFRVD